MKKFYFISLFILLAASRGLSQTTNSPIITQLSENAPAKPGISYDAISKFVQANITTENNGGFNFKSTLFSTANFLDSGKFDLSDYYNGKIGKFERNFEYTLGINKDPNGSYNIFNGGVKYAIINDRDLGDHSFYNEDPQDFRTMLIIEGSADGVYQKEIKGNSKLISAYDAAKAAYDTSHKLLDLPIRLVTIRDSIYKVLTGGNESEFFRKLQSKYDVFAKQMNLKSLLTFGVGSEFRSSTGKVDSINFSLEYLVGLGKNYNKPWNLDLQANNIFLQDTISKSGLARNISKGSIGVNKVLFNDKSNKNPVLEFEFAFEDIYVDHGPLYLNENKNTINADAVFRLHFTQQMSLPVTLKYDLKKSNIFGFISLQWNLENSTSSSN